MPSTITAFYGLTATSFALSAEVNHNFSMIRGHRIPIKENTAASSDLEHYIGESGASYKNIYSRFWDFPTAGGLVVFDGQTSTGWQIDPVTVDGTNPGLGGFAYRETTGSVTLSTVSLTAISGMTCTLDMGVGWHEIRLGATFAFDTTSLCGARVWPYINGTQLSDTVGRGFEIDPSVSDSLTGQFPFGLVWFYKATSFMTAAVIDFQGIATGGGMDLSNFNTFVRSMK